MSGGQTTRSTNYVEEWAWEQAGGGITGFWLRWSRHLVASTRKASFTDRRDVSH